VGFSFLPKVMTRCQKISHIDYNITLSKPFEIWRSLPSENLPILW
jgi:hypothetical protein